MATYLDIVNTVRQEAGIAGADLATLQNGLSAESTRIKNWVAREWLRIQSDKSQWQWMRRDFNFTLTANQALYTPAQVGAASTPSFTADQFANWKRDSFRVYADPSFGDEMLTAFMTWDIWRNLYQYGNMRNTRSRPVAITVAPDKSLGLGITPDQVYHVVGEYYTKPAALSADADVPGMPSEYHDLIIYRALSAYATFMAAPEVLERARAEISRIQPKLMRDQLPVIANGPPLA